VEVVKTNAVLGLGVLYTLDPAPTQDMILAHSPPSIIRSIEAHFDRESVQPDKVGRPLPPDPFCIASSQQLCLPAISRIATYVGAFPPLFRSAT
jgi:hypothetical protein